MVSKEQAALEVPALRPVPQGQPVAPPDLVDALRWHWKLGLLIALFVLIGGVVYAEVQPSEYDGVAVVAFTPKLGVGSDVVHVVVAKYETYAGSRALAARLSSGLGESTGALDDGVSTSTSQDTGNLTIRVRLRDPEQAAAAANAYAQAVLDRSAADDLVNSDLAAPALRPTAPSAPPRRLIEVAALLAGAVAGGAVALVLARARPRFRSWRELGTVTGYPVVARLPSLRALRSTPVRAASDPHLLPAVNGLQTTLASQLLDRSGIIVITSATRGDGRTSAAVVFAEGLARAGYEVLLIDADLQKPRLGELAGIAVPPGLFSALTSDRLQSAIRHGWVEGLRVLPTAKDSRGAEALASSFPNFVAGLQGRVDVVIIDAAPVLGASEAQSVIPGATGVLLVVPRTASQQDVGEAILVVESLGTPVLGVVANRFATTAPMRA